jgi:hypothetical protein
LHAIAIGGRVKEHEGLPDQRRREPDDIPGGARKFDVWLEVAMTMKA